MAISSKRAPKPSDTPLSVRVQVYSHEKLSNKESGPLANFRLRSSSSSTFADLSAAVIDRYERSSLPGGSHGSASEVCVVLDEQDCAFDMADPIDIVQPNEFIRFILAAASPSVAAASRNTNQTTRPSSGFEPTSSSIPATPPTSRASAFREQLRTTPAATDGDLVEVDANGTPVPPSNPKSKDDELEITAVRSSQGPPSSPTRPPAVKPFIRSDAKPPRNGNTVIRQLRLQGRTPSTAAARTLVTTPGITDKRRASTLQPNALSAAKETGPPTRAPTPVTPARAQMKGAMPAARTTSAAETTPAAGSTQVTGDGGRRGQRDPYEVPSDNEVQLVAQRKTPTGVRTPRPRAGSMNSAARGNATKPNIQNAASTTPTAPASLPRTPHKGPSDAKTSLSSAGNTNNSRHRTLKQIAEGAKTIQLSDSPSESNSTDASGAAPVPLSSKALGKLSHHSVNGHLDIVGPTSQPKTPIQPSEPIMIRHSRGVTPVYRKGESSSSPAEAAGEPLSSKTSSSTSSNASGPTTASKQRAAQHATTQKKEATQPVKKLETTAAAKQPRTPTTKVSPRAAIEHAKSLMEVKFGKKGQQLRLTPSLVPSSPSPGSELTEHHTATEPPIPDAFLAERKVSDDKYIPGSSDESDGADESGVDEASSEITTKRTLRRSDTVPPSSHDNPNGRRSFTRARSQSAVTPRNTLRLGTASSQGSVQSMPRFHRGYSKRVRDTFSDASVSSDPEEEEEEEEEERDKDDRPSKLERKTRWNPINWMETYKTTFGSPHMEIANGPFKGYLRFGPKAGTYLPGYAPPSDEEIVEAEKTAVPIDDPSPDESMTDGSSPDGDEEGLEASDTDGEELTTGDTTSEETVVAKTVVNKTAVSDQDTSEIDESDDLPSSPPIPERANITESPAKTDNDKDPDHELVVTPTGGNDPSSHHMDKSAEQLERLGRTAQYVLDHASPTAPSCLDADGFDSVGPASVKRSSPPSGASESTSVLITRQLTRDSASAPPSNQELAVLMSSSPATVRAKNATPAPVEGSATAGPKKEHETPTRHDTVDLEDSAASSTESSVGIPARLPLSTPTRPRRSVHGAQEQAPRTPARPRSSGPHSSPSADFILGGISQRRTTRSIMRSPSPGSRPNYRIPGINEIGTSSRRTPSRKMPSRGTPSKLARPATAVASPVVARRNDDDAHNPPHPSSRSEAGPSSEDAAAAAALVVELPTIAAEKRAEFDVVSKECSDSAATASNTATMANGGNDDVGNETGGNDNNDKGDNNSNDKDSQSKITHPLKSFQAINETPGTPPQRQLDPGDEADNALAYVMRESPRWLSDITEISKTSGVEERRSHRALSRPSLVPPMPTFSTDSEDEADDGSTSDSAEDDVSNSSAPRVVLTVSPAVVDKRKRAPTVPDNESARAEIHDAKRHKHKGKKQQRESIPADASPPSGKKNGSGEKTRKRKRAAGWRQGTTRSLVETSVKPGSGAESDGAAVSPVDGGQDHHHHRHVEREREHEDEPPNKRRKHNSGNQGEEQQRQQEQQAVGVGVGGKQWKKHKKTKHHRHLAQQTQRRPWQESISTESRKPRGQRKAEKNKAKAAAAEERVQKLPPLPLPPPPTHTKQQQDDSARLTNKRRKILKQQRAAAVVAAAAAADPVSVNAAEAAVVAPPSTTTANTPIVDAVSLPEKHKKNKKNRNKNRGKKNRRDEDTPATTMMISPPPTSRPSSAGSLRA